jgi:M6 family metalloprotease-like protein
VCAAAAAVAAWTPGAGAATLPPPPDSVIAPEHPPVQGVPGKTRNLSCGVRGPARDLGAGSRYDSGRGTLRAAMIFVDFSDEPAGEADPREVYDRLVPQTQAILHDLSYGALKLSVKSNLSWVRMPRPLSDYGLSDTDPQSRANHRRYIREAIRAADPTFDFSKVGTVYVMAGPGVQKRGAASNYAAGGGVEVDGHRIAHAMTLNGYDGSDNPTSLAHETGHLMGLPDLYDVYSKRSDWDHFVGPWDVMSNVYENSTTMLAWTRRQVGWLRDPAFRCVGRQATLDLPPVNAAHGVRAAVVKTGRRRAYVVEARDDVNVPFCPDAGVLLYRYNGNVATGMGPTRVIDATPGIGDCGSHTGALFKPAGEGLAHYADANVDLTVLGHAGNGFRVRVRALKH